MYRLETSCIVFKKLIHHVRDEEYEPRGILRFSRGKLGGIRTRDLRFQPRRKLEDCPSVAPLHASFDNGPTRPLSVLPAKAIFPSIYSFFGFSFYSVLARCPRKIY